MHRSVATICWLLATLIVSGWQVQAEGRTSFVTAVGAAGTDSFVFGTELWAVSQIELLPQQHFSLETMEVRLEADRLRRLNDGQADFALVHSDVPMPFIRHLKSVMVLWPDGVEKVGIEATHLIVRADIPENIVYLVTRTIFEQAGKLQGAQATMGVGSPHDATVGLAFPLHPGAHRYYEELGLGSDRDSMLAFQEPEVVPSNGAMTSDKLQRDEGHQLAAACRQAAAHGVLDYQDGDVLSETCLAYGVDGDQVDPTELPQGQGGPVLSARGEGRADRRIWKSGFVPTM